jgi:hypothetical protein
LSGFRYHNQSRPKYVKGENKDHIAAKQIIANIGRKNGYDAMFEWPTQEILHKGKMVSFPIDIGLYNAETDDKVLVQLDGGYHQASKIQIGRTANRDDTLEPYTTKRGIRYVTLNVTDVLKQPSKWVREQLQIG